MSSYYEKMPATGEVKCIDEEIPFELPNGWEWTRIRNVSQSYIGLTYSPTDVSSCGTIVLRSSNIQNGKIVLNDVVRVTKEISEKLQVEKNDIIICARNGSAKLVGKSAIVNSVSEPMTFGAFMAICKTSLYQYISIFLQSDLFFSQLRGVSSTTTINQLTQNNFNSFLVPVPPIKEQERIFEKMNEVIPVIEGYEVKQELLDKLNRNLNESIRKSVLQEAIQGKLVPQITEEGTAQELLEQIKAEKQRLVKEGKLKKSALNDSVIFKGGDNKYWEKNRKEEVCIDDEIPFEIPESWQWTRLSDCVELLGGFAFPSSALKSPTGRRVIRISDITPLGLKETNIVRYNGNDSLLQYKILQHDILLAMTGGTVGKSVYLHDKLKEELLANQRVAVLRSEYISSAYLDLIIKSPYIQEIITERKNSTNDNISMVLISDFILPIPPSEEQVRIVKRYYELTSIMRK